MTALKKLLDFADTLPNNKGIEFLQLLQSYQKEIIADKTELIEGYERIIRGTQDTTQSERIGHDMARLGNYEVVAVAGTAETLLSDVTDTNVGEINVGDTVKCVSEFALPQDTEVGVIIPCEYTATVEGVYGGCISLPYSEHLYKKSDFRKVKTPLSNPLNTVKGC